MSGMTKFVQLEENADALIVGTGITILGFHIVRGKTLGYIYNDDVCYIKRTMGQKIYVKNIGEQLSLNPLHYHSIHYFLSIILCFNDFAFFFMP
jgi:hypothetical protein